MYEEFVEKLPHGIKPPTAEQYKIIEEVYNTHPLFDETVGVKYKIAQIYCEYGMRLICDMRETAKRAGEIKDDIRKKRLEIEVLEREYMGLAMR